jgi:hypothetical protein
MTASIARLAVAAAALAAISLSLAAPAGATGTVRIFEPDGTTKTYMNVRIEIRDAAMAITSNDGQGTLVLGKAACTKVGELLRCLPYDATLLQNGTRLHIALASGTVWLNPSGTTQALSHSSVQLPPKGVLLAVKTKRGTYVTMTGTVDEVQR